MKSYTIVGNWKMHMGPGEAKRFMANLSKKVVQHTHVIPVVCPPAISLQPVFESVDSDVIQIGAQNLHQQDEGTFTGEISGPMIKQLAKFVIVGHSERRRYASETDQQIALKLAAAIRNELTPVLCVGETLHDREDGHSKRVVNDQLHVCLSEISEDDLSKLIICYEPVWAISKGDGRGKFAAPDDVEPMFKCIREALEDIFGEGASSKVRLLYGGSVNPDDCKAYLKLQNCEGLLVGGASLNYEQFAAIIKTAQELVNKK